MPGGERRQAQLVILLRRQVDDDQPVDPGRRGVGQEAVDAVGCGSGCSSPSARSACRRRRAELARPRPACRAASCRTSSARSDEAWIAGPSAIGSVKGMPSSITSAPAAGSPCSSARAVARVGIAGGDEGDQPAAPSAAGAEAAARRPLSRSAPATAPSRRGSQLGPQPLGDGEDVLVAAAAQIHDQQVVSGRVGARFDDLGQRVGGLQRRDDAFEPGAAAGSRRAPRWSVAET